MRKKIKKILTIILFNIFTLNIFAFSGFGLEKNAKVNYYYKGQQEQLKLTLNNGNIVLTAGLDSGHYYYGNFKLKIGNKEQSFDWKNIGSDTFAPFMKIIDLGNDKNAGVAIFLTEAKGVGVLIQKVHVFKIDSFKEIPVEDPLIIVKKHVKIQNSDDSITVDIDGNKTVLDKNYLNKLGISNPNIKLSYENHIVYGIKNNILSAEVGASDENFVYIGAINIDYIYKDEMFIMNKISFKKF